MKYLGWMAGAMGLALMSASVRGEEVENQPTTEARAPWSIRFEPMVWAPALRGKVEMPRSSKIDLEAIDADENEIIPAGELTLRADKWLFQFRGFGFGLDEAANTDDAFTLDGGAVAVGDRVESDIDVYGFDLTVGYELWTPIDDAANDVRLSFDVHGGLRIHNVDMELRSAGSESQADHTWFEPIIGAGMWLELPHGFGLEFACDAGGMSTGDSSSLSWDITVAFRWLFFGNRNAGLSIGFRHLNMDLSDGSGADEFEFDASLAGLFGAVVIQF